MPANAALYLPVADADLRKVFADASFLGDHWELEIGGDAVQFSRMGEEEMERHLDSFFDWIESLDEDPQRKSDACGAIDFTETVLGLVATREFEDNPALWQALFRIADAFDGYVFAYDSVLLPNGAAILGPLARRD